MSFLQQVTEDSSSSPKTQEEKLQSIKASAEKAQTAIHEKDAEIERLKEAAEESKAQIQSGMEDVIKEVEGKCRELESSFFDLQMENLQLKKELDKYKNGTGGL